MQVFKNPKFFLKDWECGLCMIKLAFPLWTSPPPPCMMTVGQNVQHSGNDALLEINFKSWNFNKRHLQSGVKVVYNWNVYDISLLLQWIFIEIHVFQYCFLMFRLWQKNVLKMYINKYCENLKTWGLNNT